MRAYSYGPDLLVPERFRGPAKSGNGGYTAGSLAERVIEGAGGRTGGNTGVEVTLRQPPPLDVAMKVQLIPTDDSGNAAGVPMQVLSLGGARIAEAHRVEVDLELVPPVSTAAAEAAAEGFPGFREHPFPSCFACGPDRLEGDGLRIFPGPVDAGAIRPRLAAAWTPASGLAETSDVVDEIARVGMGTTWAALDCIGGWAGDMEGRRMVLGRMTAQVDDLPVVGEPHVVVGTQLGTEGRKTFTASTLYDSDERVVARAQHVWIAIDPSAFN